MPVAGQFTREEKSIMKQLEKTPRKLQTYKQYRRTNQNTELLDAVNAVSILNFTNSSTNLIAEVKDKIAMKDLRCLQRKIPGEELVVLSKGAIQYLIWLIADNQNDALQQQTCVFTLNFCHIDAATKRLVSFTSLTAEFDVFWRKVQPNGFFEKRIFLFPVCRNGEVFLTIVENPKCAVDRQNGTQPEDVCRMIHVGTGDLNEYQATVGRKLLKLLELAAKYTGQEAGFESNQKRIETVTRGFPEVAEADRPFLMLYFLNRILTTSSELPDWKRIIDEFNTNRAQLDRDLVSHRRRLNSVVLSAIDVNGTRAAKLLVDQRARIVHNQS